MENVPMDISRFHFLHFEKSTNFTFPFIHIFICSPAHLAKSAALLSVLFLTCLQRYPLKATMMDQVGMPSLPPAIENQIVFLCLNLCFGCLDLSFECLDLYFWYMDLYLGVWICILG